MAKEANAAANPWLRELFQFSVYKRSQGRITRQVTFAVLAITIAIGAWRLSEFLKGTILPSEGFFRDYSTLWQYGVPMIVLAVGLWLAFRVVNIPQFADFLIAVEAEMNKVSWPSRDTLIRSSIVVMITIFVLAGLLFFYDLVWSSALGFVLRQPS